MRGAYYVAIALLIVASCSAAEVDQTEPEKVPNNGFVTSGGTVNKMLPKRVLRGSRDLKNKWAVHAGGEDRMLNRFSNENNLLEGIDQTITKAANVMGTNRDDVIVKAAEAMTNYKQLDPTLNILNSKHQLIKPRPINVYRQALLHATPNPKKSVVAVPNDVPFVLANRLEREKSTNTVNYAGRPITQHDYLPASLSFPSTSAVAPDGQFNKQLITQKALEFDLIKRPDEVKARSSKRQRTNPMLNNMDGRELHAQPNLEEPLAPVANNMPFVWATKLGEK
uniref:Secreted RxLR effector protein 39 n=1 Tax=Plasmopara viticola TaxID=143451 RepID=RLR39_PLAVT|nr:RecName: Full=Secreted RxLR effector protein 39; Flags: Precursor [Plasmopara viticola]